MDQWRQDIERYVELQELPFAPFTEEKIQKAAWGKEELLAKQKEFNKLKEKLGKAGSFKEELREAIVSALEALIRVIESPMGSRLSRNQGLSVDNYVYLKMIYFINKTMRFSGVSRNLVSDFFYDADSDFDATKLKNLLRAYKDEIKNTTFTNFLDLEKKVNELTDKIRKMRENENPVPA